MLHRAGERGARVLLPDTPHSSLALLAAGLREDLRVPVLFLLSNFREAETELRRIHAFLGAEASVLPEEVSLFLLPSYHLELHEAGDPDPQLVADRLRTLSAVAGGVPPIVVGTPEGALQPTISAQALEKARHTIVLRQEIDREELLKTLVGLCYRRTAAVEMPGEFSVRGGILDLFPPTCSLPVRIEFFGDQVESIREFDPADQLSRREVAEVSFGLASEVELLLPGNGEDRGEPTSAASESSSALAHLPAGSLVLLSDPLRLEAEYAAFQAELARRRNEAAGDRSVLLPEPPELNWTRLVSPACRLLCVGQTHKGAEESPSSVSLRGSAVQSYANRIDLLVKDVGDYLSAGGRVFFASKYGSRIREMLAAKEMAGAWEVFDSPIQDGFRLGGGSLMFLTDREVFGWERVLRPFSAFAGTASRPILSVFDLRPDDLVVHINHGIGRFGGVETKTVRDITNDYIVVNYAHGDRLFVPVTHLWRLQKYIGGEAAQPTIHPLRSSAWKTSQTKAKKHAEEIASELLDLYARREVASGFAFAPDSPWMGELEASFPYEETEDQRTAIQQVKSDMELAEPMDRLVCGEVGFGKTEVAIRAAFKAVLDGKQVALLAPTTVLAQQHFATFSERLGPQGVSVRMLSRFESRESQRATLEGVREGKVDVVVGTHRLLQSDVHFKDLGLVVVDEEQRFGVRQKEGLKKFKETVDVLTLTATPIPRTLYMALSGVRDMSLVNEPPAGRLAVKTYVLEETDGLIRDAILRELERGGQVYFVHNRVENIGHALHRLTEIVPSARVRMGHGQMAERDLEPVVVDFLHHEFDVLVCSTIIENGLDIANANTLIVRDADRLGLAQMYQLRGRVGRSNRQAYAYFLYRHPRKLSKLSLDRLQAIREMSELGAGFRLALRDLEIRGAGNILGEEQHGHIEAVGFEMYCQLLEDAILELSGRPAKARRSLPTLDLPLDIRLPRGYIPEETDRLQFYRRFAAASDPAEVEQLAREMVDRFGAPPETALNLIEVVRLRSLCLAKGVAKVTLSDGLAVLEGDASVYGGTQGRLRLHIRDKNGRMILEKLRQAVVLLPDVP